MKRLLKIWAAVLIASLLVVAAVFCGFILYNYRYASRQATQITEAVIKPDIKATPSDRSIKLPQDTPLPVPEKKPAEILSECLPSKSNFVWEVIKEDKLLREIKRDKDVRFPTPSRYSQLEGVTCFRGNNYRNSGSFGNAEVSQGKLEKLWFSKTGYIDTWTGIGWNGQPAIVNWSDEVKRMMNIEPEKKLVSDLKEVIYATLDGKIYFLDLADGKPTRSPIDVGAPHKGSVTVDPRGYPLLYAGQGIENVGDKKVPTGYRIFNLINQKQLFFLNGYDKHAFRWWPAFDSTPLINAGTDTFIECGENGLLYSIQLNTRFDKSKKDISIQPQILKYRYQSPKKSTLGTENSVAIYRNFAYFTDNSGTLQCVDLNTLTPVWIRDVTDDSDSTIALEELDESEVYLYTACEVDKQGENGSSFIRKINALTGKLLWEKGYKCHYHSETNGGTLASPVVGKNDIQNLVIYNIAKTGSQQGGKLVAFDKKSGNEVWVVNQEYYSWSSPVDIYTKDGKSYIIQCDSGGYMNLFEGISGKRLDRIPLEANIEGTPAVYDNMIVVGTRGQKIWGIRVK